MVWTQGQCNQGAQQQYANYCSTLQTYTNGDEVDGLVDAAERGDINSLATHDTGSTNAGRVLARASGDDGLDEHLDGVLIREQVDDLKGVLNDAHSHQLLAVVAAVEHHRVHQALNNGALYICVGGGKRQVMVRNKCMQ